LRLDVAPSGLAAGPAGCRARLARQQSLCCASPLFVADLRMPPTWP